MTGSLRETAILVAELCKELPKFTDRTALNSLTYLLDMAILEASRLREV